MRTSPLWLLSQLRASLSLDFAPNQSYGIVEWLAQAVAEYPEEATECLLALLLSNRTDLWLYLFHEDSVRTILTGGLTLGSEITKKRVEQIISVLSSKGETKYTDILPLVA